MSITNIYNYIEFNKSIATSGQPLPDEFNLINEEGYKAVVNLAMSDSDNAVKNESSIVKSLNMTYFHLPVPFDSPNIEHLKKFIKLMEELKNEKIWVHCAANYRVTAFMYQYQIQVSDMKCDDANFMNSIFEMWEPDVAWRNIIELSCGEIEL